MKIYNFEDIEKVFVVGDLHGNFKNLFFKIRTQIKGQHHYDISNEIDKKFNYRRLVITSSFSNSSINNSLFFIAGDCGFGFNKEAYYQTELKKFNDFLSEYNIHIIFVRGNHDDPKYFNNDILKFSNLICVPDYSIVKTKNFTTLCVGGGLSVDRKWRINREIIINKYKNEHAYKKKLYWEDEMPIYNQDELNKIKNENIIIDSVITHTAPSFANPQIKPSSIEWVKNDKELKKDLEKERETMDKLFESINNGEKPLKFWAYGHFHITSIKKHFGVLFFALNDRMDIFEPLKEIEKYNQFIQKRGKNDLDNYDLYNELFNDDDERIINVERELDEYNNRVLNDNEIIGGLEHDIDARPIFNPIENYINIFNDDNINAPF